MFFKDEYGMFLEDEKDMNIMMRRINKIMKMMMLMIRKKKKMMMMKKKKKK